MSQLKRRKQDNSFEVVGDKSLPIRYLDSATPADDDYVVIDKGTGARKCTIEQMQSGLLKDSTLLFDGTVTVGSTFELSDAASNYRAFALMFAENNETREYINISVTNPSIIGDSMSYVSTANCLAMNEFAATTNDGVHYTVVRFIQVNLSSSGVTYFNTSHSARIKVYGIK